MAYQRKTTDEYHIMANYGYGWESECVCDTLAEARTDLKAYRENGGGSYYIQKRRVRKKGV